MHGMADRQARLDSPLPIYRYFPMCSLASLRARPRLAFVVVILTCDEIADHVEVVAVGVLEKEVTFIVDEQLLCDRANVDVRRKTTRLDSVRQRYRMAEQAIARHVRPHNSGHSRA